MWDGSPQVRSPRRGIPRTWGEAVPPREFDQVCVTTMTFDLKAYMRERQTLVDNELGRCLPPEDLRPAALHKAMRYAVLSGGKRIRPILAMAAAETAGKTAESALAPAAAVELFHAYTLVHDDLPCMDDDALRRGKPTVHVAFGESTALLAGDALQALAFEALAAAPPVSQYTSADLVRELAEAAGSRGVVGGQVEDLAADASADAGSIVFIHVHKTAVLFRAALRLGGMAADCSAAELDALGNFGLQTGIAFQIADDLLDAQGAESGTTCLSVMSGGEAKQRAEALVEDGLAKLTVFPAERLTPLKALARMMTNREL